MLTGIIAELTILPYRLFLCMVPPVGEYRTRGQMLRDFGFFGDLHLGRLSVVKDVAGKSRVVGITNYWIQVALKPLHDSVMELLKKVPTDGTFDQEGVVNRLPLGSNELYSSFDLSAATDRLPIDVQKDILSHFIGKKRAGL